MRKASAVWDLPLSNGLVSPTSARAIYATSRTSHLAYVSVCTLALRLQLSFAVCLLQTQQCVCRLMASRDKLQALWPGSLMREVWKPCSNQKLMMQLVSNDCGADKSQLERAQLHRYTRASSIHDGAQDIPTQPCLS